jgi:hypothetical protein
MGTKLGLNIGITLLQHKLPELLFDPRFVTTEKLDFPHRRPFSSYYSHITR